MGACPSSRRSNTEGKTHEIRVARGLDLLAGSIVVLGRGCVDYCWLDALDHKGVLFVTHFKEGPIILEEGEISARKDNILADEMVLVPGSGQGRNLSRILRRVVVWDEANAREIVLLTNQFKLAATTIAATYKQRWQHHGSRSRRRAQIELFFKALKHDFKIKTYVGTSPKGERIQI